MEKSVPVGFRMDDCCSHSSRLYLCTNCCELHCILHFLKCENYGKCRSMYCEECFEDMEKNGFVEKKWRRRMVCPMCMDDKTVVTDK